MKRLLLIIAILLVAGQVWGTTWYVIDDPANSGTKICYKSGSWATSGDTCNTNIRTLWAATSPGDTIILSGGTSGKTYGGTQLWITSNPLTSQQTSITIRAPLPTDPDYSSHSGNVTISSNSNSTVSNTHAGTVFSGIRYVSTGGTGYFFTSSADMTITTPAIVNGGPTFFTVTGGVNTYNVTSYSGTANKSAVSSTSGTGSIVINGGIWDLSSITSVQPFYTTAGTAFTVEGGTFIGSNVPNSSNSMFSIAGIATQRIRPQKIINAGYASITTNNATTELKIGPATGNQYLEIEGGNYHAIILQNTGSGTYADGTHVVSKVFAHSFKGNDTYKSCGIVGSTGAKGVLIRNNILLPYANGIDMQTTTTTGNGIFNNTVIGGIRENCHGLDEQGGAHDNVWANNAVYKQTGVDKGQCFSFTIGTTHAHTKFDYNSCFLTGGQDANLVYGSYIPDGSSSVTNSTSLSDWQSIVAAQSAAGWWANIPGTGYAGVHDVFSDPLFVSATDFRPTAYSPLINAGTIITGIHDQATATTDYAGTTINRIPDIGAYQYADQDVYFHYGYALNASCPANGNGTKICPYSAFATYPSWLGYAIRSTANIQCAGTFSSGPTLSSLTDNMTIKPIEGRDCTVPVISTKAATLKSYKHNMLNFKRR